MVQDFAQQNGRDYRETNNRITKDSESELADILSRYERSDLVISSGLHGCVIGLCFGLKVLAVSGDRKIEAFMQAAGLKDWILDFSEVKRVPERLRELQQQALDESILREARQKNKDIAGMIKKLVSKN
jgi:polysaccharide pyruvyl transferase WcaK-like protein